MENFMSDSVKEYKVATFAEYIITTIVSIDTTGKTDEQCEQEAIEIALKRHIMSPYQVKQDKTVNWVIKDFIGINLDSIETMLHK